MEYFSNNKKEDIKNKKNPSKIYIPLNTNRVNSNSKQLGSGFPDSKTIEFFSTVNRGIQTGLITLPTSTGDNIYTIDGTTGATLRTITNPSGIKILDNNNANTFIDFTTDETTPYTSDLLGISSGAYQRFSESINSTIGVIAVGEEAFNITSTVAMVLEAPNGIELHTTNNTRFALFNDGLEYRDFTLNKKGLRISGYGETGNDDGTGTADYSTLVNTSLVPKRYVDDEIAFYGVDKIIEITTATHSVLGVNATYHVTAAGSTLTIQTSVISDGNRFRIKDAIGNASVNNIVIQTQGAELIDGDGAGVTINTDYGYIELYCFNNNLFIKQ